MRAPQKVLVTALFASFAFGVALTSNQARADLSVSAVGTLDFSNASISTAAANVNTSLGTSVGFGFLASTSVIPMFSLELGALYVPRKVNINDSNGNNLSTTKAPYLEIPLLLRFTALPIVSIGAGPYYAHSAGSLTVSAPNVADTSPSFSDQGVATSDFGVEASVAASFPILPMLSVMGDLRYLWGLTNLDSSGVTTNHARDVEFLVGLTLSL